MKREEVTTPILDYQLTVLETSIALSRKRRRSLLRWGHILTELERNPDFAMKVTITFSVLEDATKPIVRASATPRNLEQRHAADDLMAWLTAELGPPVFGAFNDATTQSYIFLGPVQSCPTFAIIFHNQE
jgi:hypothetical protein